MTADTTREVTTPSDAPVVAVVGPTGVGKSAVALSLCRRFGGEIVSVDSVQVYRGFDIGSAKPDIETRQAIPHHLIDVTEPTDPLDAQRFADLADAAIGAIHARGNLPIITGGTGLWLRALMRGLLELPPVEPALRGRLQEEYDRNGAANTHARLSAIDPRTAAQVHPNDRVRVVRALEVHAQTGAPLGELRHRHALGTPRYHCLALCLDLATAHHRPLLHHRMRAMLDAGWVEEVRALVDRHGADIRPLASVGYRQLLDHVHGDATLEAASTAALRATVIYARRQRTWFASDPTVDLRMTPDAALQAAALERLEAHLRGKAPPDAPGGR